MKTQGLVQQLSAGIESAIRSSLFCVGGTLPNVNPDIQVTDFGRLKLPLKRATAKRLMEVCDPAPYGQGTKTLVNPKVRNAFELSPEKFAVTNPYWDEQIAAVVRSAAERLGLPADRLEARLYKLLLYGTGGFFLPHRDSEKHDRMVASLIVALPSEFSGGELKVRHQNVSAAMRFQEAATGKAPCYAAFYADCEHEVARVDGGFRLCLAYNLVLQGAPAARKSAAAGAAATPAEALADSMSAWVAAKPSEPLVFALDHHYTERGLTVDLLKGTDRDMADLVLAAADHAGCLAYLCQVARHTSQQADDGNWDRRRRYTDDGGDVPDDLELGEIFEEELAGEQWVAPDGSQQPFPAIAFDPASIVARTPLDEWKPTREEYEGFTGNAGNTLDRWYHRSAVCVWHRNHHFAVLAAASTDFAIATLGAMVDELKKAPKKCLEEARHDGIRLAQAIIEKWPTRHRYDYRRSADRIDPGKGFAALLATIDDPDTTLQFLSVIRQRDPILDLGGLIVAACRKHGCARFAGELTAFFAAGTDGDMVRERDFLWLGKLATAQLDDPARMALVAHLAPRAVARFCASPPPQYHWDADSANAEAMLPPLLLSLLAAGDDALLQQAIEFVTGHPERFSLEKAQVPGLEPVVAWCREQGRTLHPLLAAWLRSLQQQLARATAAEPQPPSDWGRPAEVVCTCPFCAQLSAFLADPNAATAQIRAAADKRTHVIQSINQHQCDVTHKVQKTGSPHLLVLTKTNQAFARRKARYAADLALLKTVNGLLDENALPPQ